MGVPGCACAPPDGDDWTKPWLRECDHHKAQREALEQAAAARVAAECERWQRVAAAAQAVTTGGEDKLDYFEVPSHLMAALALALDEGPNARGNAPDTARAD